VETSSSPMGAKEVDADLVVFAGNRVEEPPNPSPLVIHADMVPASRPGRPELGRIGEAPRSRYIVGGRNPLR